MVNSDYFHAMQVPIAVGRTFSDADDATAQPVAIVNETFVRHYFKDAASAIGRRVAKGSGNHLHYMTIVGVVRDTRHTNLRDPSLPTLFMPLEQVDAPGQLFLYLRTATPPEADVRDGAERGALDRSRVDVLPACARWTIRSKRASSNERMIEVLALVFGGLAALLAGVGIYGVLAYTTVQRTREIGIRIALGSTRLAISGLVLKEMLRLGAVGVLVACAVRGTAGAHAA